MWWTSAPSRSSRRSWAESWKNKFIWTSRFSPPNENFVENATNHQWWMVRYWDKLSDRQPLEFRLPSETCFLLPPLCSCVCITQLCTSVSIPWKCFCFHLSVEYCHLHIHAVWRNMKSLLLVQSVNPHCPSEDFLTQKLWWPTDISYLAKHWIICVDVFVCLTRRFVYRSVD